MLKDVIYRKYKNSDFGIKNYVSKYDKDNDGIDDQTDILNNVKKYISQRPKYKSKYYETGYPDDKYGVCTDVIGYGLKNAGYDLRNLVNEDIIKNKDKYNIDKAKFVFDIKNCELINRIYLVDKVKNFAEIGIVTSTVFGKSENKIVKKCACDNVIMATKKAHDSTIKKINMTTNCNKIILEERNKILERVSIQENEPCAV